MENDRPPKRDSLLSNPQILAAIIGGAVTIIVAIISIVPLIVNNKSTPTPQPTVIIITATTAATHTLEIAPTSTPMPQVSSTDTPQVEVPVSDSSANLLIPTITQGNVLLLFDDVSFTLRNQGDQTISLEGIVFRSTAGQWEARMWGPSVYKNLPAGECLRLRDATVGQRQPPAVCRDPIYGLQVVGTSALFWIGVDSFDVLRGDEVITTCHIGDTSCLIEI
jgi:hypothetical protein